MKNSYIANIDFEKAKKKPARINFWQAI